jgi:hypothetical protein
MRLRTCDPTVLDDLRAHFERSGFAVESTGDTDLDVRRPDAPSPEQEAWEIELHPEGLAPHATEHPGRACRPGRSFQLGQSQKRAPSLYPGFALHADLTMLGPGSRRRSPERGPFRSRRRPAPSTQEAGPATGLRLP